MPTRREEIEEIIVDCHDEDEQMYAWLMAFCDDVNLPFQATLLGMPIEVTDFRVNDANTIQCQVLRENKRRWVGVEDLDEEGLPADMNHVLTLYHAWLAGDY